MATKYWQVRMCFADTSFTHTFVMPRNDMIVTMTNHLVLRLQTIKAIINSRSFKSPKSDDLRRVQVVDLYCLTRFESESSSREIVY